MIRALLVESSVNCEEMNQGQHEGEGGGRTEARRTLEVTNLTASSTERVTASYMYGATRFSSLNETLVREK